MADSWTVLKLLTWTTDFLKSHGSESPRLDAEVLLAHARGCERIMLYAAFDQEVDEATRAKFRELVKRRSEGVPVAYLVGQREFYSLAFYVTPDVLIPRPETEFVVVAAIDAIKSFKSLNAEVRSNSDEIWVADVGTGSGAIAVAVARHAAEARIVAIDISPAALAVARQNAEAHQVGSRIEFVVGDLLEGVSSEPRFAVIASNPPYVGEQEVGTLSESARKHEPHQALFGGPTGTEIIERLIPQAAARLLAGGWLIMELSPLIAGRVVELLAAEERFEPATVTKDLAGLARVVKTRRLDG